MSAEIGKPTPEGDALRAAARDLAARFPDLPAGVVGRLNGLARIADAEGQLRRAREHQAEQRALSVRDLRGRWVRRHNGNGGPGLAGIGHVAGTEIRPLVDEAVGLCGAKLRGLLDWEAFAASSVLPPVDWRPCPGCVRKLADQRAAGRIAA